MKRLLGQIGITYLSALAVVFYFGTTAAIILSIVFGVVLVATLLVKKARSTIYLPVMAAVALVACIANIAYTTCVYDKVVEEYHGYSGTVSATLKDEPYEYYGSYCYRFSADMIDAQPCDVDFVLYHDELLDIEPFDKADMEIAFSGTDSATQLSKGYFLVSGFEDETPKYTVHKTEHKPLYYYAIRLRQGMRNVLEDNQSDDAFSLCSALLIGDKYALSDDVRQDFREAGVSHIIVVSGMHFSILVSFFLWLARKLGRYRVFSLIPAILFIIMYMFVTGYSPSVMRSGIMLLIYTAGLFISRDVYSINSLGLAALAVTVSNPYSVGDVGLILSFATTLSIIKLSPKLYSKFAKRIKTNDASTGKLKIIGKKSICFLIRMLCVNISAFAVSLPLSILFFGAVSTVSVISTFVLYYPIQLLLILSLVLCLVFYIPVLAPLLGIVIEWLSHISVSIVSFFADLPFSYLYVVNDFVYLWLLLSLLLYGLMYLTKSKDRIKVMALSSTFILLVGYVSATLMSVNTTTLNVYDVDNGMAVMYNSADINAVLALDCSRQNAVSTISKMEDDITEIDFYSSVADTANSLSSLETVSKEFAISNVLLYDTKRDISMPSTVCSVAAPSDVHTVNLGGDTVVTYCLVDDVYITYLNSAKGSVLILPQYIDAADIPESFRTADTIVINNCPLNFEVLSCDTLIISAKADSAYNIMKFTGGISRRVLLTAQGDIRLIMEV